MYSIYLLLFQDLDSTLFRPILVWILQFSLLDEWYSYSRRKLMKDLDVNIEGLLQDVTPAMLFSQLKYLLINTLVFYAIAADSQ
jgi:hypothetical protein